jgi:hypothetical protein
MDLNEQACAASPVVKLDSGIGSERVIDLCLLS